MTKANIYAVDNTSQMKGRAPLPDGAVTLERLDHQCVRGRVSFVVTLENMSAEDANDVLTSIVPGVYASLEDMVEAHRQLRIPKFLYAANSYLQNLRNGLPVGELRTALVNHAKTNGASNYAIFIN